MKNPERAERVIKFIECLTVPSGVGAGRPFLMRGFQRDFIHDVYSPINTEGLRVVRRAVLSEARKNGKTALIAGLVLAHLVGPEAVINGEVYSAATEREQAALVYKVCSQIVRADPELEAMLKLVDSTKTMVCYENGSFYRALSAEAGTKHGLNPSMVIYDELAQARDRNLYDVLDTSMGAREEPLFVTISTQSNDPQHILSQLIDDGLRGDDPTTVTHLYETPMYRTIKGKKVPVDIFDEKEWYASNPALGDFRGLEDIKVMAARAKRMPSFENTFRNLYLNQRVDAKSPLIPRVEWEACEDKSRELGDKEDVYIALDLSGSADLTAMVILSAGESDTVRTRFWKPKDLIKEHELRDRVPYSVWEKQGVIEATPGRTVNHGFVAKYLGDQSKKYNILGLAYDRWRVEDFRRELDDIGIPAYIDGKDLALEGAIKLIPWGQGFKDMAPAIDAFESSILDRRLKHDGNPCLTWNVSNAITASDPAGNRKLDKSKIRFRIDGAVALAMALGLKSRTGKAEEKEYKMFFL